MTVFAEFQCSTTWCPSWISRRSADVVRGADADHNRRLASRFSLDPSFFGSPSHRRQAGEEDMAQNIQDVMTPNPFLVGVEAPVAEAARMMRSADVGSLIVLEEGAVCGIVTDRDI